MAKRSYLEFLTFCFDVTIFSEPFTPKGDTVSPHVDISWAAPRHSVAGVAEVVRLSLAPWAV